MRNELANARAMLSALLLTISSIFPVTKVRRGMATWVTVVIIFVIVIAGAAIVVTLVFFPGGASTTTVYP